MAPLFPHFQQVLTCVISSHLPPSPPCADSGCPLTQHIVPLSCTQGHWHKHTPVPDNEMLIQLRDAAALWVMHTHASEERWSPELSSELSNSGLHRAQSGQNILQVCLGMSFICRSIDKGGLGELSNSKQFPF